MSKKSKKNIIEYDIPSNSESLRDSFFLTIFNNNPSIMLLVDPENEQKILDANKAALKFYGYTRKEFLNLKMGDINTTPLAERKKLMEKAINLPNSHFQFDHITKSSILKTVEVNASPVEYNNKKAMFIVVHDISELIKSEERLEMAVTGTDLGIWDWKVQTGELYINDKWAQIIGYTVEELSPISIDTWNYYCHPDDLKEFSKLIKKYFNKEIDTYKIEIRMKHKNGSWVWILDRGKVFEWDESGKPIRMSGTHVDITERKRIEQKLVESEAKFRSYFEKSPLSLWEEDYIEVFKYLHSLPVADETELYSYLNAHPEEIKKCVGLIKVIDVNKATLTLYEADNREMLLDNFQKIFTASTLEGFRDELISYYKKDLSMVYYFTDKTLKGREIDVKLEMTLLSNYKYLATITDITELKRKELERNELLAQSKADSETKEILLREVNHRVKNNLSSFIGMLYAEKKQSENSSDIYKIDHVDSLINRVKGISSAHELLSKSQWAPIKVDKLIEKIIQSLDHLIPKDRSINVKIDSTDIFLDADQSHSIAIIINELFSNSIKHAVKPGETVKVDIDIKEKSGIIFFTYSDSGPGYTDELLELKFSNVGMYLLKNIIEQSLRGIFRISNDNGAKIEIEFPGGSKIEEL